METETPEGLHRMQYATHILEEVLCWPSKGNAELLADCILSLSRGKKLSVKQAHDYLVRAVTLAKAQCITVDRYFFMNGDYTNIRPSRKEIRQDFKIDPEQTKREQESPEWEALSRKARERLRELAGMKG